MKTIVTIAHPRTGSTFLINFFATKEKESYNAKEFYGNFLPTRYKQIKYIYFKNDISIPSSYQLFLDKAIYILSQVTHYKRPFQEVIQESSDICNLDMINDFTNTLKGLNYECFFYKLIRNVYLKGEGVWPDFVKHCSLNADTIIINYRKSILDTYISLRKAEQTGIWMGKKYKEEYDFCKVVWDLEDFKDFSLSYINYYYDILKILEKIKKDYVIINYEELCNSTNKQKFISDKIKLNKYINKESNVAKQSTTKNLEDNFENSEQFKKQVRGLKDSQLFLEL